MLGSCTTTLSEKSSDLSRPLSECNIEPQIYSHPSDQLRVNGLEAYFEKDYLSCLEKLEKAADLSKHGAFYYLAAICAKESGQREKSKEMVSSAIKYGYSDFANLVKIVPTLKPESLNKNHKIKKESKLAQIFEKDQMARSNMSFSMNKKDRQRFIAADKERFEKATEILATSKNLTSDDFYYASIIYLHNGKYMKAYKLATKAYKSQPLKRKYREIVAMSLDRYLNSKGCKQKYTSQVIKKGDTWKIADYDESVTDRDRIYWGLMPIKELENSVKELNAKKDASSK